MGQLLGAVNVWRTLTYQLSDVKQNIPDKRLWPEDEQPGYIY
jgi:hypothetical protein